MTDINIGLEPDYPTMEEMILDVDYCQWSEDEWAIFFECGLGLDRSLLEMKDYNIAEGFNIIHKRHHDNKHKDDSWCVTTTIEWDYEVPKLSYTFDCTCKER